MNTTLLIGAPATGKTERCLARVMAAQSGPPLKQVWVVVPDRTQAGAFRRRLAERGGALGVQVGRFEDLYQQLLTQRGMMKATISLPLQNRLIREAIHGAAEAGELTHFVPIAHFPGLVTAMREAIVELKRALVSPERLLEAAAERTAAQREMGVIFRRYQERLRDVGYADDEDVHQQAVALLERDGDAARGIALLVVDGFDQFTTAQYLALKLLSGQAQETLITLPGSLDGQRTAHQRFTESMKKIQQDLSPTVEEITDGARLPEAIGQLEKFLFEQTQPEAAASERPMLLEARSAEAEAREALRWIKKLVVREGVALGRCAIFTPNAEVYHPLLRAHAEEFGIAVRFTLDDPLAESALVTAMMNLLRLPLENFRTRKVMNVLRSPYFDFGIDAADVDTLEMISRAALVVEGREQWDETWRMLRQPPGKLGLWLDDERSLPNLPREAEAEKFQAMMDGALAMLTPPAGRAGTTEWIGWTEALLARLGVVDRLSSEAERSAMVAWREILRALAVSEAVAGKADADYAGFMGEVESLVRADGYRENIHDRQPALVVGRMTEARGVRYAAVALLGLAEGSFPVIERADPFLDEALRAELGLESRLAREQGGLFYQAVTRADRHLLMTRPYLAEDGEDLEASLFWKAAAALLDSDSLQRVDSETALALADAGSREEILFQAVRRKGLPRQYGFLEARWHDLQQARDVLRARRAKEADSPFEGAAGTLRIELAERFGPAHGWSASRLETYGACPFYFYVSQALGLIQREQPEVGLKASQLGSMLHEALELTYAHAQDYETETLLATLREQAGAVFAYAPERFGFRASALWEAEQRQYLAVLEATIRAIEEDDAWTPYRFEQRFGISGEPALQIDLGEEAIILRGLVDRIDQRADGGLRIVDYKTGGSHLNKKDLEEGLRLQLPIYALAARDALGLGEPVEGFYWHIQGAKSGYLKLANFRWEDVEGPEAAYAALKFHLNRILMRIRAAQFAPQAPSRGCPDYCPAAQWCWKYESQGW